MRGAAWRGLEGRQPLAGSRVRQHEAGLNRHCNVSTSAGCASQAGTAKGSIHGPERPRAQWRDPGEVSLCSVMGPCRRCELAGRAVSAVPLPPQGAAPPADCTVPTEARQRLTVTHQFGVESLDAEPQRCFVWRPTDEID